CATCSSSALLSCERDKLWEGRARDARFGRRCASSSRNGECGPGPGAHGADLPLEGRKPPVISPSWLKCRCRCSRGALQASPLARVAGQERHLTAKGISRADALRRRCPGARHQHWHSRCIWHRRAESSVWLSRAANPSGSRYCPQLSRTVGPRTCGFSEMVEHRSC